MYYSAARDSKDRYEVTELYGIGELLVGGCAVEMYVVRFHTKPTYMQCGEVLYNTAEFLWELLLFMHIAYVYIYTYSEALRLVYVENHSFTYILY